MTLLGYEYFDGDWTVKSVVRMYFQNNYSFFVWIIFCGFNFVHLTQKFPLDGEQSVINSLWRMGAGASAGMTATLLTHPFDVVRARITVQQTQRYRGI